MRSIAPATGSTGTSAPAARLAPMAADPSVEEARLRAVDCVFCAILAGTAPAEPIAETEGAFAFMHADPAALGHVPVTRNDTPRTSGTSPPRTGLEQVQDEPASRPAERLPRPHPRGAEVGGRRPRAELDGTAGRPHPDPGGGGAAARRAPVAVTRPRGRGEVCLLDHLLDHALGVRVDVAASVPYEAHERHPEALGSVDRQ